MATVNRIAQNTQYGTKTLLDGSKGATGVVSGANLEFVGATQATQSSGATGYEVSLTQAARRAQMAGTVALTNDIIDAATHAAEDSGALRLISLLEGGYDLNALGESVCQHMNALEGV